MDCAVSGGSACEIQTFSWQGITLEYTLSAAVPEGEERLPLLVWIPQEDGKETENRRAFSYWREACTKRGIHFLSLVHCPQPLEAAATWKAVQLLLFFIRKSCRMDVNRIYLAGCGEGASAVWQLLGRYPRMFAGAVAAGGYGEPYRVRCAKEVPIWAFYEKRETDASGLTKREEEGNLMVESRLLLQGLFNAGAEGVRRTEVLPDGLGLTDRMQDEQVLDWLCGQSRRKIFRVERIRTGVWKIDDYFMSSCYLIEGSEKALLIDTGMGEGDFQELICQLTDRPVSLAVTHPHIDHMYHAGLFDEIYIHHEAAENFSEIYEEMSRMDLSGFDSLHGVHCPPPGKAVVHGLREGETISLGKECEIEAAFLPGHTEYDCIFVDDRHRCVFTGDAVGSGYTVGVPLTKSGMDKKLRAYESALEHFLDRYGNRVLEYSFLGGHFIQENGCDDAGQEDYLSGLSRYFMPLSLKVFEDMKTLCARIREGSCKNEQEGAGYSWTFGCARISGSFPEGDIK